MQREDTPLVTFCRKLRPIGNAEYSILTHLTLWDALFDMANLLAQRLRRLKSLFPRGGSFFVVMFAKDVTLVLSALVLSG